MGLEKVKLKHNSPEWLQFRKSGIGGSEAAAILGLSPFKSNVEVWEEKVGTREPTDISDNPVVKYGTQAEDMLVKLFALDFPEFKVRQNKTVVYKRGFMFASLDAEITDAQGCKGFLECKTSEIHSRAALDKWNSHIPDYYYTQLLHYFIVTGWDFAYCKAQLKQTGQNDLPETVARHYPFFRKDLKEEMRYLYLKEKEFWGYVERKERPPLLLPNFSKD